MHHTNQYKIGSEFDITVSELAYPRVFEAETECPNPQCDAGHITGTQTECKICDGTGFMTSNRSVLNITKFAMSSVPEDQIDPSKMVHYVEPPISSIELQSDIIANETIKAVEAVYNPDVLTATSYSETATATKIKTENIFDKLHPFAEQVGRINNFFYKAIAASREYLEGFTITTKVKSDFAFKTMMDLVAELESLTKVGVAPLTMQAVSEIARKELQPKELLEYQVKAKFDPFIGKSTDEITNLINNKLVAQSKKVC